MTSAEGFDVDWLVIGSGFGGSVSALRLAEKGVVNARQEVFGYRNLLVCDGSVVPANPGVNPSLTITAMTELAMTHVPRKVVA